MVKESGYGCFSLPIEVYFKSKEEPRKVRFEYELFLQNEGPPISHVRHERMTFKNPSEDFRMKLIKGGGVSLAPSLLASRTDFTVAKVLFADCHFRGSRGGPLTKREGS